MALLSESRRGNEDMPFCSLVARHKARLNHHDGESLNIAKKKGTFRLLEKMLEGKRASEASLSRSFNISQSLNPQTRPVVIELLFKAGLRTDRTREQVDAALLKLVQLENGVSVHFRGYEALKHVAGTSDNAVLRFLLEYVQDNAATSVVVSHLQNHSKHPLRREDHSLELSQFDWLDGKLINGFWKTKSGFDTLELLLKNSAKGETVNKALILAIAEFNMQQHAEPFMDFLLTWYADVNYNSGRVLQIAATQGNIQILPRLFACNASVDSSLMAFPYLLFISGEHAVTDSVLCRVEPEIIVEEVRRVYNYEVERTT